MPYAAAGQIQPRVATAFRHAAAIAPADNTPIGPFAALYVGAAGNVTCCLVNDTAVVTFVGVAAGTLLPVAIQGVNATGTTATNLIGLG